MKKLFFMLVLALLPGFVSAANLIVNGSFEDTHQANGTWAIYPSVNGWSLTSGSGIEVRNNVVGTASDGVNFVELDARSNSSIQQTVTTQIGRSYTLDFDYSPRIHQSAATNGISAFWNGNLLASIALPGGNLNNWLTLSLLVKGTGHDVLSFAATGISDSLGGNIDNISLNANTVVPVPAALWLMLSGMGVLGFGQRRKST